MTTSSDRLAGRRRGRSLRELSRPVRRRRPAESSRASTASAVSISSTGSLKRDRLAFQVKEPDGQAVAGGLEIEDRLGAVDLRQHLSLLKAVALGDVPLDDRRLGLGGALGGQVQRHSKQRLIHECICQTVRSDGRRDPLRVGPATGLQFRRKRHRHVGRGQQPRRDIATTQSIPAPPRK